LVFDEEEPNQKQIVKLKGRETAVGREG